MCEIMDLPPVLHITIQGPQYIYLFKYLYLQMSPEQEDILGMLECLFCVHYLTKDIFFQFRVLFTTCGNVRYLNKV